MPVIDPVGVHHGERLQKCSFMARMWYPYMFAEANALGRFQINYEWAYSNWLRGFGKDAPTEDEWLSYLKEYADNYLLFVYEAGGEMWAEWWTERKYLPRHANVQEKKSPAPDEQAFQRWKDDYLHLKQRQQSQKVNKSKVREIFQARGRSRSASNPSVAPGGSETDLLAQVRGEVAQTCGEPAADVRTVAADSRRVCADPPHGEGDGVGEGDGDGPPLPPTGGPESVYDPPFSSFDESAWNEVTLWDQYWQLFVDAGVAVSEHDKRRCAAKFISFDESEQQAAFNDATGKVKAGTWPSADLTPFPWNHLSSAPWKRVAKPRILPEVRRPTPMQKPANLVEQMRQQIRGRE